MAALSNFLSARLFQHCSASGDLHAQMLQGEVAKSKWKVKALPSLLAEQKQPFR